MSKSSKTGGSKKPRDHKVSRGARRSVRRKAKLSDVQLVCMGKGIYDETPQINFRQREHEKKE